jgi:hypothetical protein
VSDIQSLTVKIQELQRSFDFWNTGYVWLVAFTVLLAAVVFFTQFMSIKRGKELSEAQAVLLKLKDEQLITDLKDKDVKIASATARAQEAEEKAEKERLERIRLEENLAWRRLSKEDQQVIASQVAKSAGIFVSLWYGQGDKEAETFAWELGSALDAGGWKVFSPAGLISMKKAGVPLRSGTPHKTGVIVARTPDESALKASESLVNALVSLGFDVEENPETELREAPEVLVNIEVRPQGPQGKAKIRNKDK